MHSGNTDAYIRKPKTVELQNLYTLKRVLFPVADVLILTHTLLKDTFEDKIIALVDF